MNHFIFRILLAAALVAGGLTWSGEFHLTGNGSLLSSAEAVVGRPATPVSYAGVARRTTVRVATPGLGAPGVGVRPGNRGGPVNRVGRR